MAKKLAQVDTTPANPLPVLTWTVQPDGILCHTKPGTLKLQVWSDTVVRVTYVPGETLPTRESLVVISKPDATCYWKTAATQKEITLSTRSMQVRISRKTGAISFHDAAGKTVLREDPRGGRTLKPVVVCDERTFNVTQKFALAPDEAIYGLGQHQDGHMNYRGKKVTLIQTNWVAVTPVLVSSRGYGIYWDNYSHTTQEDGCWWSEVGDGVDYYFMYGPALDQVIAGYRMLSGAAPLFGRWGYGLWQCKEHYHTQEELLEVVREYRRRKIPCDGIVQDWCYWSPYPWGSNQFDPIRYPDPAGMIREVHKNNMRFMISVWPKFETGSECFKRLHDKGYLFNVHDGDCYYDAYSAEARKLYWNMMDNMIFTKGVDAWWLDATEPEVAGWDFAPETYKRLMKPSTGTSARYMLPYALMTCKAVYEGQRESNSDKRVFILTRSAFAGLQRYASVTWSGDITATWEVFRNQISAGLNFCLSGIPYWTTDIGAFFVKYDKGCENEEYREMFVRWFQYGAFCPMFRVHGSSTPREMWKFGDVGTKEYETQMAFDHLRYRLMPYIYSLAARVTFQHDTMMRALVMDFPGDRKVLNIDDQFMFGPALLVNPVTKYKARTRDVYMPACEGWFDFWTGKTVKPGVSIKAPAPFERLPLYVRAGSILPMGPFMEYAAEKPADPIELRVYPGRDASFTIYEDENDNYNYENGRRASIPVSWSNATGELTIGRRDGEFPGMLNERRFQLVLVRNGHGAGIEPVKKPDVVLEYNGTPVTVTLRA